MYAVILAGGGGTRLWPLSTAERPKPFLPLVGARSMLADTVRRLLDGEELPLGPRDVFVVADERYADLVRDAVPEVNFLPEPAARSTAAAIALVTARIERPEDEVMLVLPADHRIAREGVFRKRLAEAARVASGGPDAPLDAALVTLGIAPDYPATGYGYLVPGDRPHHGVARLAAFEEKPHADRARALLRIPGVAWNAGVFVWQRQAIAAALEGWAPDLWASVSGVGELRPATYAELRSVSIDYAVMEPAAAAGLVAMVTADVGWSDIGSWTALLAALGVDVEAEVVPAGGAARVEPNDLLVRRVRGELCVETGPADFYGLPGPSALLRDAAASRSVVEDLLERVAGHPRVEPATLLS